MTYNHSVEFIEAPIFTKLIPRYFKNDEDYSAFQDYLLKCPDVGDLIPGSGGLRKIRWAYQGRGKRGGIRVIYYYKSKESLIWLLTMYAKNEMTDLPREILRRIKEEIEK